MKKLMGLTPLLLALLLAGGCGKSGSGNVFSDICDDYCDRVGVCTGTEFADKQCVERCLRVYDRVEEVERTNDEQGCTAANTAAFKCASTTKTDDGSDNGLTCSELKEYLVTPLREAAFVRLRDEGKFICSKKNGDDLDCCEQELVDVVDACPASFQFAK